MSDTFPDAPRGNQALANHAPIDAGDGVSISRRLEDEGRALLKVCLETRVRSRPSEAPHDVTGDVFAHVTLGEDEKPVRVSE